MTGHPGKRPARAALLALVDRLDRARVAVAGDAVLDVFQYGVIARISREAPVLILEHRHSSFVPGGAANTDGPTWPALDVATALVGRDRGRRRRRANWGGFLERSRDRGLRGGGPPAGLDVTPTKTRILAGSPQAHRETADRAAWTAAAAASRCRPEPAPGCSARRARRRGGRRGGPSCWPTTATGPSTPGVADRTRPPGGGALMPSTAASRSSGSAASRRRRRNLERGRARREGRSRRRRRGGNRGGGANACVPERLRARSAARDARLARHDAVRDADGRCEFYPGLRQRRVVDVTGAGDTVIAVFTGGWPPAGVASRPRSWPTSPEASW